MPGTLDGIDERIERLEALLAAVDGRVQALEREIRPDRISVADREIPRASAAEREIRPDRISGRMAGAGDVAGVLALIGRTFVVLAGAYLLRAITEAGALPSGVGTWLALGYAAAWLAVADRSAASGRRLSSLFHAGAALLIALPLLAEATTRFHFIAPGSAAAALAVATALALVVAWRRQLHALAWIATLGATATVAVLVVQTAAVAELSVFLVLLGIATLWLGYDRDWYGPRWVAAGAADLTVLGLTLRALTPSTGERPSTAIAVQFLLLASYLATLTVRTLVRRRSVIPFEVAQTAAALAVGLGGAVAIARATGSGALLPGIATTALAIGCYIVALLDRQQARPANFFFYGTLGLVLMLIGTGMLLSDPVTAVTWIALAVAAVWWTPAFARPTLTVHAAVYALAAARVSGADATALASLAGPVAPAPTIMTPVLLLVAVAVVWMLDRTAGEPGPGLYVRRGCRAALSLLLVAALGGTAISVAASILASRSGVPLDAGVLATLRTLILSAAALVLAFAGTRERFKELGWFLYPVLAGTAMKLVSEDVGHSPPAMLFLALAAYGGALIVAPRLAKRAAGAARAARPDRAA